ncbi:hypothetical protein D3C71_1746800 [compost metagenome]
MLVFPDYTLHAVHIIRLEILDHFAQQPVMLQSDILINPAGGRLIHIPLAVLQEIQMHCPVFIIPADLRIQHLPYTPQRYIHRPVIDDGVLAQLGFLPVQRHMNPFEEHLNGTVLPVRPGYSAEC